MQYFKICLLIHTGSIDRKLIFLLKTNTRKTMFFEKSYEKPGIIVHNVACDYEWGSLK